MAEEKQVQPQSNESSLPLWECQWRDPIRQPNEQAQVGDLLRLTCEGSADQHFNEETYFLEKEDAKHVLKILKVNKSNPGSIDLVVTSYRAAEYKDLQLKISDGQSFAMTSPLSFKIQSVLPTDQETEPYPYYGPFEANYSVWVWIVLAAVLMACSFPVIKCFRKRRQKRKLIDQSETQMREQTLLHDMAKFYRLQRKVIEGPSFSGDETLKAINKTMREYLIVRYKVPAFDWSRSAIINDIKKYHKNSFEKIGVALQKLMFELEANKGLDVSGGLQLLESFRRFYELSEKVSKESASKGIKR